MWAAGLALALASCARPPDAVKTEVETAVIVVGAEPTGVNPLVSGGSRASQDLIDRLFLKLFEEQPDFADHPPTFEPRLASEWSWSEDHLQLDIELRPGVLWSDGVEVTADDVHWTWLAQRDPRVAWPYAELKKNINEIQILGSHRLRVLFAQRAPNQLAQLNAGNILPRHAWSRLPFEEWPAGADWFRDNLVTNGPFRLGSWHAQQEIVLEANESYFEASEPKLERVVLRIVPLRQNRLAELVAGRAHFVAQLTPPEAQAIAGEPDLEIRQFWHRQYDYLAWNTRLPALTDAATRRALVMAIDRPELIAAVWHDRARVGKSPIPTNVWAHHRDLEGWPFDPEASRAALAASGWTTGAEGLLTRNGTDLAFEILVNAGNPIHVDAAVLVSDQLTRIGVAATVRQLEFHSLIERLDAADFDAAIGSWGIDTSLDLGYAFHSRAITEGFNSGGYANPRVDELIDRARQVTAHEERRRILHELQELLHLDQPYAFLWEPPRLDAHSRRLLDVQSNALSSLFRLREWSLDAL